MYRFLAAIGSLIGIAGALLFILLLNGGYVYRTECPRAGGSTERDWTYRWSSVLPYIGYERTGCESHTATRLAFDALGLWTLPDDDSRSAAPVDHSSEYPRQAVEANIARCVQSGRSRSFCECAIGELTIRMSPRDFNRLGEASRRGAETFAELPVDIREAAEEAASAAERDCD